VPELSFDVLGARAERYSLVPTLTLRIHVGEATGVAVHAIALRCQIRVEPHRRRYSEPEVAALFDLFGESARWADTLKPLQFATISTMVPGFTGSTEIELPVPCSYDLEVASTKYFRALDDGEIPLLVLYSGTLFYLLDGRFAVEQIPWSLQTSVAVPVSTWRAVVEEHFPHAGWIRLDLDTLRELGAYKSRAAAPTWDATVLSLLRAAAKLEPESESLP
jgi:hypothetical protein